MPEEALRGIRVLDLSHYVSGAYCGKMFAALAGLACGGEARDGYWRALHAFFGVICQRYRLPNPYGRGWHARSRAQRRCAF